MEKTTDKGEQMTPPKGYKHTELGVLPEDWEVVRLGDVCEIKKGKVNPKKTETIPCVELEHISQDTGMLLGFIDSREQLSIKNSFSKGDVLFGKLRPYLRKFWRASFDGVCSSEIWVLQGKKVSNAFLFYLVQTARFSQIANATCGTKMPRADWKLMQDENFAIPPLAEQEKIAEILSTWDTQIQNFETLITEKQALKKGLCQTLLTAKTRLKGFSGDWEVVRLGDVCEINPKSLELPDTFIYIDLESVSRGKLCSVKYMKKTNAPSRAKRTLQKHDILFQMVRPYQKNNLYFNLEGDYVASTGYAQIRTKQSSGFVFQYIHSRAFVDRVIEKCTGSNYPAINATDLSQIEIPLPPLAEQEKIAEILSEVDNGITLLEQKLESLKSQKKGIIQILLNGKVRVK